MRPAIRRHGSHRRDRCHRRDRRYRGHWQYLTVMENARLESTRLQFETARENLARSENVPVLEEVLVLRDTLAHKLGYKLGRFPTEIKMAKNGARAQRFLERLKPGLQPKFDAEIAEFRAMKAKETGDANAANPPVGLALLRQPTQERKIHRR